MTISETGDDIVHLGEAGRQLEQAAHDGQVAYDSIALGNLGRAHTYAIMARAAADSAETWLRARPRRPACRWPLKRRGSVSQATVHAGGGGACLRSRSAREFFELPFPGAC